MRVNLLLSKAVKQEERHRVAKYFPGQIISDRIKIELAVCFLTHQKPLVPITALLQLCVRYRAD